MGVLVLRSSGKGSCLPTVGVGRLKVRNEGQRYTYERVLRWDTELDGTIKVYLIPLYTLRGRNGT